MRIVCTDVTTTVKGAMHLMDSQHWRPCWQRQSATCASSVRRPACLAESLFPLHLVCSSAHKSGCCSAPHAAAAATKMAAEVVAKKRKSSSSEDKQKDKKSKRKAAEEAGEPHEGLACMRRRTKFGLQPQNARLNRAFPLLQSPQWLLER